MCTSNRFVSVKDILKFAESKTNKKFKAIKTSEIEGCDSEIPLILLIPKRETVESIEVYKEGSNLTVNCWNIAHRDILNGPSVVIYEDVFEYQDRRKCKVTYDANLTNGAILFYNFENIPETLSGDLLEEFKSF